jgi:hypothetical protein
MSKSYGFCVPIVPGGEQVMRDWIKKEQSQGPDHARVFNEAGVTREQVWIQRTPMGDFAVACWDSEDPERTMKFIGTSNDPWAARFREMLSKVHGVDFSKPMPMNEQVRDWQSSKVKA